MTLTEAEADKLPLVARMTACPVATPMIAPPPSTVATVGESLDHVTEGVVVLLTVAVAGSVAFVATTGGTWIDMVDGGGGDAGAAESELPPQAATESGAKATMKSRMLSTFE